MNRVLLLCVVVLVGGVKAVASRQTSMPAAWGNAEQGLRLGLATASESERPEFLVAIENTTNKDVVINLGLMLANGKVMFPRAVHLILSDAHGTTRTLEYFDKRYPSIGGRVDDFIVALRAGSTYVMRLSLNQYFSASTKEFDLRLPPGPYRIEARFEGDGAKAINLDTPGIALLNFWKGSLRSNSVAFQVR